MRVLSIKSPVFRAIVLTAAAVVCWFSYRAYNDLYDQPLEANLMADLKIEQVPNRIPVTLNISGQPMYSGMVVRKVTTNARGSVLFVTPRLALVGLAKPLTKGKFEYQVVVPDSIDEVRLGKSEVSVWRRNNTR